MVRRSLCSETVLYTSDRLSSFMPVTTDVVCTMVRVAADKHSTKDQMPTWLFKTCIDLLAPYIASLFNLWLSSRIVPTSYKDAYVIPCLKKPPLPCGDLSSYRPISNLSFLSKLLERVVSVQLTDYLSSAGLLPVHQSAYRKFHSTKTALLKVVTDLIEAIDAGDHALLGLLVLSAAFDTVDHDVLVERLARTYGLRSTALDWLRSYLCDRRQTVLFDGGLLNCPLSLLWRPSGLRARAAAVPALHCRPGLACCQSRPIIPLLR